MAKKVVSEVVSAPEWSGHGEGGTLERVEHTASDEILTLLDTAIEKLQQARLACEMGTKDAALLVADATRAMSDVKSSYMRR